MDPDAHEKEAEWLPWASEDRFRRLVDGIKDYALFMLDSQGYVASWNAGAERIKGWREEEILGQHFSIFYSQDDIGAGKPNQALAIASAEGQFQAADWRVRKDGSKFFAEVTLTPLYEERGALRGFGKVIRDVTERMQAEKAIKESEERYRLAVMAFHGGTYDTDLETGYAYRSPRVYQMLGVLPEAGEPSREWWFKRIHPDDAPRFHQALDALLNGGAAELDLEFRLRHENGTWVWVWQRGLAVRDSTGRLTRTVGALLDISERKRAEAALRETEQRLRATYEHASVGIAEIDPAGRFLRVNEQLSSMSGYTREELLTRTFAEITHPDDRAPDQEQFRRLLDGEISVYSVEKRFLTKGGRVAWAEVSASRVDDMAGRLLYSVRVVHDISKRKRAEQSLRELAAGLERRIEERTARLEELNRRLASLAAWPTTTPSMRAFPDLDEALSRAGDVLRASRILVVWGVLDEPYRFYADWREGKIAYGLAPPAADGQPDRSSEVQPERPPDALIIDLEVLDPIADAVLARSGISFHHARSQGRIFVEIPGTTSAEDVLLMDIVAARVGAEIEKHTTQSQLEKGARSRERMRVAQELHDGVLQSLTAVRLQLRLLERDLPGPGRRRLDQLQEILEVEQRRMRRFVESSRAVQTEEDAGMAAWDVLQNNARRLMDQWEIEITVVAEPADLQLTRSLKHHIERIFAEAVSNAVRHGCASRVRAEVRNSDEGVTFAIQNDGLPFPDLIGSYSSEALRQMGAGPTSLLSRVHAAGGKLVIHSGLGPVSIEVELPTP